MCWYDRKYSASHEHLSFNQQRQASKIDKNHRVLYYYKVERPILLLGSAHFISLPTIWVAKLGGIYYTLLILSRRNNLRSEVKLRLTVTPHSPARLRTSETTSLGRLSICGSRRKARWSMYFFWASYTIFYSRHAILTLCFSTIMVSSSLGRQSLLLTTASLWASRSKIEPYSFFRSASTYCCSFFNLDLSLRSWSTLASAPTLAFSVVPFSEARASFLAFQFWQLSLGFKAIILHDNL